MEIGGHIPVYLFCEQFVGQENVLDIYPFDDKGTNLLAKAAREVVVVQRRKWSYTKTANTNVAHVTANLENLPFASGSFDQILFFADDERATQAELDAFLKAARSLLRQTGLVALTIPNRDAKRFEGKAGAEIPGFFDLERSLRRHFPHVTLFAHKPLHGAVITPIGRRGGNSAPLLDDRMLPEEGEVPNHYMALCSPRYRKVDETMIAQLPYSMLVDRVRERLENYSGKMQVAISESGAKSSEINKLEARLVEATELSRRSEVLSREKSTLAQRLTEAERQIKMRDELLEESEKSQEEHGERIIALDHQLHDSRRRIRSAEQRSTEMERLYQVALKEHEEAHQEREKVLEAMRAHRIEQKAKQHEIDDAREEKAGVETELEERSRDLSKKKRALIAAQARITALEDEIKELREQFVETDSLQAELARTKGLATADRERFEEQLEEEHRRLLAEMDARGDADRAREEAARLVRDRTDELKRQRHQIDLVTERASKADERVVELKQRLLDLNHGLEDTESRLGALRGAEQRASDLNDELDLLRVENAKLVHQAKSADRVLEDLEQEKKELAAVRAENEELRIQEEEARARISDLEEARVRTVQNMTELEGRTEKDFENVRLEGQRELARAKEQAAAKIAEVEEQAAAKIAEVEEQAAVKIAEVEERFARMIEELEDRIALEIVQTNDNQNEELSRAKQENEELQRLENKANGLIDRLGEKLITAKEEIEDLKDYKVGTEKIYQEFEERTLRETEQLDTIKTLERRVEQLIEEKQINENEREQLEGQVSKIRVETDSSDDNLQDLLHERDEALTRMEQLERSVAEGDEEREAMEHQVRQIAKEMEEEMIKVSNDLELELRHAASELETKQGEIWELREEAIRLRATVAAAAASAQENDQPDRITDTLAGQEFRITELSEECEQLRKEKEKQGRSLKLRKKNLKMLANLLTKSQDEQRKLTGDSGVQSDSVGINTAIGGSSLMWEELDVSALLGEIKDELREDELDDDIVEGDSDELIIDKMGKGKTDE
jgi:chromosome segregation ATPase/SAM-dependent methyltransferase